MIDAYRIVKEEMPEVQLALVGSMATDDPEGWDFFNATIAHADGDPDIHILNNFNNVGAIEVNAFQSHSDVLIQKSTREGFGLTVTEAIWKGRPFIGGDVGGIPLQIEDGVTGFLVDSVEQCAAAHARDPAATRRSASALGPARQGARAHALPHAALPARLPADLHASCWRRRRASAMRRITAAGSARAGLQPRARSRSRTTASVKRGTGGLVTALTGLASHRDAVWIASAMTEGDAAGRASTAGGRSPCARRPAASTSVRLVVSDPEAYDRFYNVFANPMLWFIQHYLWDLSNAPDIRRNEIEAFEFGYNVVNEDLARGGARGDRGHERAGRDGPRLPPLHAARRSSARARPDVFLHHFIHIPWTQPDAWRVLPDAHPRGDLPRAAGQRHHRLPHRAPTGATSCSAAATCWTSRSTSTRGVVHFDGPRGVGARLPAADRRRGDPRSVASSRARARVRGASCCAAGAST